jgi:MarR family transcriptional regulator, organic hydroperoxide resistance regulator
MEPLKKNAVGNRFAYSLYFSAGALAREAEKLAVACWKPVGLSPSHAQIILLLMQVQTIGPSFLAKSLLLSRSTMTRLLDSLERKGLINRFTYDKVRMVQLSVEAAKRAEEFLECDMAFRQRCYRLLGEDKTVRLMRRMNDATDRLRNGEKDNCLDDDVESSL